MNTCDSVSPNVTFSTVGQAFGPYSGTFTEEGTWTYSLVNGFVTGFQSTFHISSPAGEVTGTKTLTGTGFHGFCTGNSVSLRAQVRYEATIVTSSGTFTESGTAFVSIGALCSDANTCPSPPAAVVETFQTSDGVLPEDRTGKATGGGQLEGTNGSGATFGFEAKSTAQGGLRGRCIVVDHATSTQVTCLDVTSYSQVGNSATWTGNAVVDGVPQQYRINIQDNGEPNQGVDTFAIDTATYDAGGQVVRGDVQVHKHH